LSCWVKLKQIVDEIVNEQVNRSRSVREDSAKIRTIIDIYNNLHSKITVDENVLIEEVLKTGKFSEEEAKSLIKKVKEEKIEVFDVGADLIFHFREIVGAVIIFVS